MGIRFGVNVGYEPFEIIWSPVSILNFDYINYTAVVLTYIIEIYFHTHPILQNFIKLNLMSNENDYFNKK